MTMTSKDANRSPAVPCDGTALLNRLPVAVLKLDADMKVRLANAGGLRFLGLRAGTTVKGRALSDAAVEPISRQLGELGMKVLKTREPANLRSLPHDGLMWDVDVNVDDCGLVVTAVDVTQRVKDATQAQAMAQLAAERLTVSALEAQDARDREAKARADAELRQQWLDAVFASMAEPVIAYGADGRVVTTNRAAQEYLGADLVRLDCREIARLLEVRRVDGSIVAAQDLPGARALRGETVTDERLCPRVAQGVRTVIASSAPIMKDGRIRGAVVVFTDVGCLEETSAALRKSEERFRAVLENSLDAAYRCDVGSDTYEYLSPVIERITGYPAREFLSQGVDYFLSCIHPDDRHAVDEGMRRLEAGGNGSVLRYRFRCKDGTLRWLADAVVLHATSDGRPAFYAGSIRDITEAKAAEEAVQQANDKLREADQRKNEFLAVLSHELRNPLAPIRNSVYISERATPGGEQSKRALSVIDRQVTHLGRIIDDLLDVTRISRGKVRLQPELTDLNEIVHQAGEDVRGLLRDAGIAFEIQIADHPVRALVDRTRIAQVLGNLLHNAIKFTPKGGRVTLALRQIENQAAVQIRDTGAGMAPQLIEHLFEPFVQAAQTLDRSRGGLGLGLALAKGLVDLHGGSVSAESDGPGKGSTFTVRLPLPPALPETSDRGDRRPTRRIRVLVIEDNLDAALSLKEVLEMSDHLVDVAFDGNQGIQKARQDIPDLILCDIGLPGVDGFEVAKTLRADARLARTYLVALSGYALQEDIERSLEAGFDRHLSKPPDMALLEKVIAETAGRAGGGGSG